MTPPYGRPLTNHSDPLPRPSRAESRPNVLFQDSANVNRALLTKGMASLVELFLDPDGVHLLGSAVLAGPAAVFAAVGTNQADQASPRRLGF